MTMACIQTINISFCAFLFIFSMFSTGVQILFWHLILPLLLITRLCLIFFRILYFRSRFNLISGYALTISLFYGFPIQPYSPFTQCANTFLSHYKKVSNYCSLLLIFYNNIMNKNEVANSEHQLSEVQLSRIPSKASKPILYYLKFHIRQNYPKRWTEQHFMATVLTNCIL